MVRTHDKHLSSAFFARFASVALVLCASVACESGGVGDPCTPEDEFFDNFSGFDIGEVNVESRSFQCETRVCLVNKFQGRVSCPYGTRGSPPDPESTITHDRACEVPGFGGPVTVPVEPQRTARRPEVAVYCSCRCAGEDPNARYCECPSGFECTEIVRPRSSTDTGSSELAGSYCVRSGSDVDPDTIPSERCEIENPICGTPPDPS